jgi:light-regulated signal transduction histidine kinase (bacteriophytochrome)
MTASASLPDFSSCDREPIHIPGAIQPLGFLLALEPETLTIRQASANATRYLTGKGESILGLRLEEALPDLPHPALAAIRLAEPGIPHHLCTIPGRSEAAAPLHAVVHRSGDLIILELEENGGSDATTFQDVYPLVRSFMETLHDAETEPALCLLAAREMRRITGVDRVLIYRFDPDWNGTVLAEDGNGALPSYLGLRFPASDIPAQARALYQRNRLRIIPDANYQPVDLLALPEEDGTPPAPLDMSMSNLRSVSPVHLEYMRNMGTMASMSVSLLCDGRLWGLISCHHATPLFIPFHVRAACDHLGQILSLQLAARGRVAQSERRNELRALQVALLARMAESENFLDALARSESDMLKLVDAAGAAILFGGNQIKLGDTPDEEVVEAIADWLVRHGEREVFTTANLTALWPEAAAFKAKAAGILAIGISQIHPAYVIWFRPEIVHTVNWGGNPREKHPSGQEGRLHPRRSFDIWRETVRDTCLPWDDASQGAAGELRSAIVGVVLRKAEELASLTAELKRSNKELEAFSYSVSHDLRAPFRHIVGFAELLREREGERVSPRGRHYIDSIIEAAFSAGTLVDNLLSFSQMGRAALNLRRTDMNDVLREARHRLITDQQERAIEWQVGDLGVVKADPMMVRLVMQNLLDNALKFTRDRNPARIVIQAQPGPEEIMFEVRDNGVGFDMAYVDKLFGVFQRLHHVEEFEGTGIGLANVRRIIERHGGRSWAEGKEGEGAAFFFTLPIWKGAD